ncbi:hypothetical protein KKI23_01800 [Patescibacteria group bacterium]|nr:hypothetical protein [Patescibacteria group bacterium]
MARKNNQTNTPNPKDFKQKGESSPTKWVFLIATPFVILILMAVYGFIRLAQNQDNNANTNLNTNQSYYTDVNYSVTNLNIKVREDSDFDGLIDYLELRLGTGLTTYDTDEDTFFDGEEVVSGFSPKGRGTFTGEGFLQFCQDNFTSSAELDYDEICYFVAEFIEVVRRMTKDESGNSDVDIDQMAEDFCQNKAADSQVCISAIDLSLSLYLQGVTEVTDQSIEEIIEAVNQNANSNTNS